MHGCHLFYVKRKMHGANNLLFGLTNDAFGYILTKVDFQSFPRYDYVSRTSLGEMTGEILIEKWLELEAGVTPLFSRHTTEWDTDLLFKKPWTLSKKAEFMIGVGPQWVHSTSYGKTTNSISGEAVLDFMFWPSAKRRFGWYLEPGYEYNFGRGHEQSVGITGGLLIGIPWR